MTPPLGETLKDTNTFARIPAVGEIVGDKVIVTEDGEVHHFPKGIKADQILDEIGIDNIRDATYMQRDGTEIVVDDGFFSVGEVISKLQDQGIQPKTEKFEKYRRETAEIIGNYVAAIVNEATESDKNLPQYSVSLSSDYRAQKNA